MENLCTLDCVHSADLPIVKTDDSETQTPLAPIQSENTLRSSSVVECVVKLVCGEVGSGKEAEGSGGGDCEGGWSCRV